MRERHERERARSGRAAGLAGQDAPEEPAQEGEPRDPGGHRHETQRARSRAMRARTPRREGPELPV